MLVCSPVWIVTTSATTAPNKGDAKMITAYFRDEQGNTLTIDAPTFARAYQQAVDQGFYVYDYDTEEWTAENEEYNRIDQRLRSNGSFWGSK
jgi:hypothetical protein